MRSISLPWKCLLHVRFELVFALKGVFQSFWRSDPILKGSNAPFTSLFKLVIFDGILIIIKATLTSHKSWRWGASDTPYWMTCWQSPVGMPEHVWQTRRGDRPNFSFLLYCRGYLYRRSCEGWTFSLLLCKPKWTEVLHFLSWFSCLELLQHCRALKGVWFLAAIDLDCLSLNFLLHKIKERSVFKPPQE